MRKKKNNPAPGKPSGGQLLQSTAALESSLPSGKAVYKVPTDASIKKLRNCITELPEEALKQLLTIDLAILSEKAKDVPGDVSDLLGAALQRWTKKGTAKLWRCNDGDYKTAKDVQEHIITRLVPEEWRGMLQAPLLDKQYVNTRESMLHDAIAELLKPLARALGNGGQSSSHDLGQVVCTTLEALGQHAPLLHRWLHFQVTAFVVRAGPLRGEPISCGYELSPLNLDPTMMDRAATQKLATWLLGKLRSISTSVKQEMSSAAVSNQPSHWLQAPDILMLSQDQQGVTLSRAWANHLQECCRGHKNRAGGNRPFELPSELAAASGNHTKREVLGNSLAWLLGRTTASCTIALEDAKQELDPEHPQSVDEVMDTVLAGLQGLAEIYQLYQLLSWQSTQAENIATSHINVIQRLLDYKQMLQTHPDTELPTALMTRALVQAAALNELHMWALDQDDTVARAMIGPLAFNPNAEMAFDDQKWQQTAACHGLRRTYAGFDSLLRRCELKLTQLDGNYGRLRAYTQLPCVLHVTESIDNMHMAVEGIVMNTTRFRASHGPFCGIDGAGSLVTPPTVLPWPQATSGPAPQVADQTPGKPAYEVDDVTKELLKDSVWPQISACLGRLFRPGDVVSPAFPGKAGFRTRPPQVLMCVEDETGFTPTPNGLVPSARPSFDDLDILLNTTPMRAQLSVAPGQFLEPPNRCTVFANPLIAKPGYKGYQLGGTPQPDDDLDGDGPKVSQGPPAVVSPDTQQKKLQAAAERQQLQVRFMEEVLPTLRSVLAQEAKIQLVESQLAGLEDELQKGLCQISFLLAHVTHMCCSDPGLTVAQQLALPILRERFTELAADEKKMAALLDEWKVQPQELSLPVMSDSGELLGRVEGPRWDVEDCLHELAAEDRVLASKLSSGQLPPGVVKHLKQYFKPAADPNNAPDGAGAGSSAAVKKVGSAAARATATAGTVSTKTGNAPAGPAEQQLQIPEAPPAEAQAQEGNPGRLAWDRLKEALQLALSTVPDEQLWAATPPQFEEWGLKALEPEMVDYFQRYRGTAMYSAEACALLHKPAAVSIHLVLTGIHPERASQQVATNTSSGNQQILVSTKGTRMWVSAAHAAAIDQVLSEAVSIAQDRAMGLFWQALKGSVSRSFPTTLPSTRKVAELLEWARHVRNIEPVVAKVTKDLEDSMSPWRGMELPVPLPPLICSQIALVASLRLDLEQLPVPEPEVIMALTEQNLARAGDVVLSVDPEKLATAMRNGQFLSVILPSLKIALGKGVLSHDTRDHMSLSRVMEPALRAMQPQERCRALLLLGPAFDLAIKNLQELLLPRQISAALPTVGASVPASGAATAAAQRQQDTKNGQKTAAADVVEASHEAAERPQAADTAPESSQSAAGPSAKDTPAPPTGAAQPKGKDRTAAAPKAKNGKKAKGAAAPPPAEPAVRPQPAPWEVVAAAEAAEAAAVAAGLPVPGKGKGKKGAATQLPLNDESQPRNDAAPQAPPCAAHAEGRLAADGLTHDSAAGMTFADLILQQNNREADWQAVARRNRGPRAAAISPPTAGPSEPPGNSKPPPDHMQRGTAALEPRRAAAAAETQGAATRSPAVARPAQTLAAAGNEPAAAAAPLTNVRRLTPQQVIEMNLAKTANTAAMLASLGGHAYPTAREAIERHLAKIAAAPGGAAAAAAASAAPAAPTHHQYPTPQEAIEMHQGRAAAATAVPPAHNQNPEARGPPYPWTTLQRQYTMGPSPGPSPWQAPAAAPAPFQPAPVQTTPSSLSAWLLAGGTPAAPPLAPGAPPPWLGGVPPVAAHPGAGHGLGKAPHLPQPAGLVSGAAAAPAHAPLPAARPSGSGGFENLMQLLMREQAVGHTAQSQQHTARPTPQAAQQGAAAGGLGGTGQQLPGRGHVLDMLLQQRRPPVDAAPRDQQSDVQPEVAPPPVEAPTEDGREAPDDYLCPITLAIMKEPVVAMDGHSYERVAIESWFKKKMTSPKTGAPLPSTMLLPNHTLRSAILEWKGRAAS